MRKYLRIVLSFLLIFFSSIIFAPRLAHAICTPDSTSDCLYEALEPISCAGVNGYLGQINIASVVNLQTNKNLGVTVKFWQSNGVLSRITSTSLIPKQKVDFVINDLGLEPDTIGTVCIETDGMTSGAWTGGVYVYKAHTVIGSRELYDFALYTPFANAEEGRSLLSLNTYRIGMVADALVANWVTIADARPGDSTGVKGQLRFLDANGAILSSVFVEVPDGGRRDFSGHDALGANKVGSAEFIPLNMTTPKYFSSVTRYYYQCPLHICQDVLTAVNLPRRPVFKATLSGGISTVKGEFSVLEFFNSDALDGEADLFFYAKDGELLNNFKVSVPSFGSRHVIINKFEDTGILNVDKLGSVRVVPLSGSLSVFSMFYKLSETDGFLRYAYGAPLGAPAGNIQLLQYNSFLLHNNEIELVNSDGFAANAQITFTDHRGEIVWNRDAISIPAHGTKRITVFLPVDGYGTALVQSASNKLFTRIYTSRNFEYTYQFYGINPGIAHSIPNRGIVFGASPRVMPLGDSITEGKSGHSSYRYWLWNMLKDGGINANFVGSNYGVFRDEPKFPDFDQDHEGHSGYRTDEILDSLRSWLRQSNPEVILLHIGTNDVLQHLDAEFTTERIDEMIDIIREENPIAQIVLAKLIPVDRMSLPVLKEINATISTIVAHNQKDVSPLLLADQYSGYDEVEDNYDGVHPNDAGERKMAGVWFNTLAVLFFGLI